MGRLLALARITEPLSRRWKMVWRGEGEDCGAAPVGLGGVCDTPPRTGANH
jgi:hypothetical protein